MKLPDDEEDEITQEAIRDEWKRYTAANGGLGIIPDFAAHLFDSGFVAAGKIRAMAILGIVKRVKDALRAEQKGVPFAQPHYESGKKTPFWQQLELFSPQQVADLIDGKLRSIQNDIGAVLRIRDWAVGKYGSQPAIQRMLFAVDQFLAEAAK